MVNYQGIESYEYAYGSSDEDKGLLLRLPRFSLSDYNHPD